MAKKTAKRSSRKIWEVRIQLEHCGMSDTYWVRAGDYQTAAAKAIVHQRREYGIKPGRSRKTKILRIELVGTIDVE